MENASQTLKPKEREIEEKCASECNRVLFFFVVWPLTSLFLSLRKTEEDTERKCGEICKISLTQLLLFP